MEKEIDWKHPPASSGDHCAVGVQSISWFCNKAHFWIIIKLIPCCFIIWFAKEYSASLKSNHFRFRGSENHKILSELIINHGRQIVLQYLEKNQTKTSTWKNHKRCRGQMCCWYRDSTTDTYRKMHSRKFETISCPTLKKCWGLHSHTRVWSGATCVPTVLVWASLCLFFMRCYKNYSFSPEDMTTEFFFLLKLHSLPQKMLGFNS